MPQPTGSIYEIRWQELCPWLILAKALRVSLLARVLLLAWVGLLLTEWGWSVCESSVAEQQINLPRLESEPAPKRIAGRSVPPGEVTRQINRGFIAAGRYAEITEDSLAGWLAIQTRFHIAGPLVEGWHWLSTPFRNIFYVETNFKRSLLLTACGLWAIAVWAFCGGAIARTSARYLTREEIISPLASGRAAISKWPSTAGGPLIGLLFALVMALPFALVGVLLRVDLLALLAGVLWCFWLVGGIMLAIVLVALWFGWPLMWATIAVERSDAFDAASRTAAYVYQRPLRLVFYVTVATLLGLFGQLVVSGFVTAGDYLTDWAVGWGAGTERTNLFTSEPQRGDIAPTLSGSAALAARSIHFWKGLLASIAAAYPLAYLFSSSVAIYLLLRLHVDSTELNEIVDDPYEHREPMPELVDHPSGIPNVAVNEAQDLSTISRFTTND